MIEMLGVLAIIGVLSVGGIAGYSKAMTKFKINKTADQIATIMTNVRTLMSSQKGCYISDTVIKKAHLAPDDMYESASSTALTNAFGGSVSLGCPYGPNTKIFYMGFHGISEEACMELGTMDWGSSSSSGVISVTAGGPSGLYGSKGCNGQRQDDLKLVMGCPNGSVVPIPIPVSEAAKYCSGDNNVIGITFQ